MRNKLEANETVDCHDDPGDVIKVELNQGIPSGNGERLRI
jgi:hypothetical protein